ncbi:hypothetical protein [Streptomyces sp. P9-A4]|uniref:hypothetical protein n=1 Tax=Streptomyces sp. P9-A4 TaxID=3072285 RepID=UPI002FCA7ECF
MGTESHPHVDNTLHRPVTAGLDMSSPARRAPALAASANSSDGDAAGRGGRVDGAWGSAAVFRHAVEESWLVHARDTRGVRPTDDGHSALRPHLRLTEAALTAV